MVGRRPFPTPPADLLTAARRQPPATFDEFSAADRVFGTVEQRAEERAEHATAYRGHVVISPIRPEPGSVQITTFGKLGLPLIELGAPKPSQARFYNAADPTGKPMEKGMLKADMYGAGAGLRGFKVFARHRNLEDQDKNPEAQDKLDRYVREKVRARVDAQEKRGRAQDGQSTKLRTKRNASVLAWVRAGSTFTFDIDVTNMTGPELGALLWLLDPHELAVPRELEQSGTAADFGVFRLGRGRPLGLGSVTLEVLPDGSSLVQGEAVTTAYRDLSGRLGAVGQVPVDSGGTEHFTEVAKTLIETFRTATGDAVGHSFDEASHIAALRRAATGYGDGVRVGYPRGSTKPRQGDDISEIVAWFQLNEKVSTSRSGAPKIDHGYALPSLTTDVTPLRELREK